MSKPVNEIAEEIANEIMTAHPGLFTHLDDLGNVIGIVLGKYINGTLGYEKEDFLAGLDHGISLSDGTHG